MKTRYDTSNHYVWEGAIEEAFDKDLLGWGFTGRVTSKRFRWLKEGVQVPLKDGSKVELVFHGNASDASVIEIESEDGTSEHVVPNGFGYYKIV